MLNTITVMGRIVKDPELRYTQSQTPVTTFAIACERDGDRTKVDFLDIVAWKGTAEFITKYFSKGSLITILGRLQVRDWNDKDDNKRRSSEIIADKVYFGDSKKIVESNEFTEINNDLEMPF